ncbi:low molecular weight protein-tyrosine-phosphatase [Terasakiella sp. A23]|uniref:low molecular weight protein-tyrosine-phosphatase n=1 Tax=Terasakiella sp. FCG-A23 TaxID=3080561 RepID=UPI0029551951|nr:low molecular weight protein-tyrosine-phosphatase [Terasakiella sp. A23]MDV7339919.1 low molecular weight protein-tyrosine-phosphatase [Terasakiella sp. A23]
MVKVLFVCLGNICRSPSAEGVFRDLVEKKGLKSEIIADSAGTSDWHVGGPPDERATKAASIRGVDISTLKARQVTPKDFIQFDYVLAMDRSNYAKLQQMCPDGYEDRLHMFLTFYADSPEEEVPDPYYGGPAGFDYVLDLIEEASVGLIKDIETGYLGR